MVPRTEAVRAAFSAAIIAALLHCLARCSNTTLCCASDRGIIFHGSTASDSIVKGSLGMKLRHLTVSRAPRELQFGRPNAETHPGSLLVARRSHRQSPKGTSVVDQRASEEIEAVHRTKTSSIQESIQQWMRARPDLDLTALIFAMPALRLGKIVEDHWDRQCVKHFGLRSNDMRVLLALRRVGPPHARRPTDLFQSLLVTSGAITKQVDRLARRKLVERLRDPNHGGGRLVHLTPQGMKVSNKAVEMIAGEGPLHDALTQIPRRERQAGLEFLVELLTLMGQ